MKHRHMSVHTIHIRVSVCGGGKRGREEEKKTTLTGSHLSFGGHHSPYKWLQEDGAAARCPGDVPTKAAHF